jgi:hypothetical protein
MHSPRHASHHRVGRKPMLYAGSAVMWISMVLVDIIVAKFGMTLLTIQMLAGRQWLSSGSMSAHLVLPGDRYHGHL